MTSIRDYIALTEKTYSFRIKTLVPLEEAQMCAIEKFIMRYDPIDITKPVKTLFQANPLDFANVPGSEVYIVDITLGLPVSPFILQQQIVEVLGTNHKFVVVRGDNDPIEVETERLVAQAEMAALASEQGLTPQALLDDPEYSEATNVPGDDLYGNEYNKKFLGYLKKVADEKKASVPVVKSQLFSFLPAATLDTEGFNNKVENDSETRGDNPASAYRSIQGNYDSDKREYRRVFKTKTGTPKTLSVKVDGVRNQK